MRKDSKGFTLVEVTIILLVLVILSGILLPTIERFIDLARYVKVKEDVGMIAAVIELWKVDNCTRIFKVNGASGSQSSDNRVDLLVSAISPATGIPDTGMFAPVGVGSSATSDSNWLAVYTGAAGAFNVDTMDNQLVTNTPMGGGKYPSPGVSPVSCGWRGAYISGPIGPDPWGTRYMANVMFLGSSPNDVFVLSAGPDKIVQTPFQVDGASAKEDDLIALISGGF